MSTLPAKKPSAPKRAASKKGNTKTRPTSQRQAPSAVTEAKAPTLVEEPQVHQISAK